jgi:hypothetical protein
MVRQASRLLRRPAIETIAQTLAGVHLGSTTVRLSHPFPRTGLSLPHGRGSARHRTEPRASASVSGSGLQCARLGLGEFSPRPSPRWYVLSGAQTSSLLCRGFPIRRRADSCGAFEGPTLCRLEVGDTAGWKPALRGLGTALITYSGGADHCREDAGAPPRFFKHGGRDARPRASHLARQTGYGDARGRTSTARPYRFSNTLSAERG